MTQCSRFNQFQGIGWHKEYQGRKPRLVACSACTLHKSRYPLGTSNLNHSIHRPEIYSEIQTGGANHHLEDAFVQGVFYPSSDLAIQGSMVHGHPSCPIGPNFQDFLVPHLRLGAGIGKDQHGFPFLDGLDYLVNHANSQVT